VGATGNNFNLSGTFTNGTAVWTVQSQTGTATGSVTVGATTATPTVHVDGVGTVTFLLTTTSNQIPSCGTATNSLPIPTISGLSSVCINSTGNVYTTELGKSNYIWTITGGTITAGGGTTNNTATVTWTSTGAKSISVNYTDANSCTASSATLYSVTVNPLPTAFSVTGGGSYCSGGTGSPVGLSGSEVGVNYQLKLGGVNTGSPVVGNGSAINFGNQIAAGIYTVVATNASTSCTSAMTGSVSVTINPSTISNNTIAIVSRTCSIVLEGTAPVTSCCSYTYQWYTSTTNASAGSYSPVGGATAIDYTAPVGSQNNWYYRMVICADGATSQSNIIHSHPPLAAITSQTDVICYGGNTGIASVNVTDGNPQYTYQWKNSSGTVLLSGTSSSGSGFTSTINNLVAGTYTFTVIDSDNPEPCTQVRTVIITEPTAFIASIPTTNYCSAGTNTISVTATGGTPGYSYQWQNNGSNITGQTSSSYNASTAGTYTVVVKDTKGCTAVSSGTVTVSAIPTVTNTPLTEIICSGNNTALVTLTSNVNGTTFLWTASGSAGVTGFASNGTGTIPVQTITTTGASPGTVTYTITPTGPTPLNCPGTPSDYVITVNPVATVNAGNDQAICSGSTVTLGGSIGGAATSATWSGGTGTFAPNANTLNAVYTPSNAERTAGTVTLTLTTNDPAGPCNALQQQPETLQHIALYGAEQQ
jgi:hypothetical protein